MSKTRASSLSITAVEKSQVYVLLVDSSGNPVLDAEGYEQVADLEVVGGRLRVDAAVTVSPLNITHTAVAIGAGSTLVLAANANRKYLLLENDSDTNIYISYGVAAILYKGIRLNANGGSHELPTGFTYTGAIYAINSAGAKNLLVTEGA